MPKSVKPRTLRTRGVETSAETIGYVTWSSIRSGLRPGHSVETITWTSEMSGTASTGIERMAHTPHTVSITVPVKTRNRFRAHQSTTRSIMWLLRGDRNLPPADFLAVALDADGRVPVAGHHHVAGPSIAPSTLVLQRDAVAHLGHLHFGHRGHEQLHRHVRVRDRLATHHDHRFERGLTHLRRIGLRRQRDVHVAGGRRRRAVGTGVLLSAATGREQQASHHRHCE